MVEEAPGSKERRRRERRARVLGIIAALAVVAVASLTLRWPALIVAALVGYGVYRLAGGGSS